MADLFEQFTEVYDEAGRAQFAVMYGPLEPVGVSDWVEYVGDIQELRFADNAPGTLLCIQVWSRIPREAEVQDLY